MKELPWGFIVSLLLTFGIGVAVGHRATTGPAHFEPPAAAVVLPATPTSPHGAVILAREPERQAKPAQAIPKGDTVERVAQVTIKPETPQGDAQKAADDAAKPDCSPVTVDMSLVREPDGGQRIIASSPQGEVVGGYDVPLSPVIVSVHRPWAAGASYGTDRTYGGWIERDVGRLRFGADVQQMQDGGIGARIRLGFTFGG